MEEAAEASAERGAEIGMVGAMEKDGTDIGTITTIMAMEAVAGAGETSMTDTNPRHGLEVAVKARPTSWNHRV